jgi:imidazolonepropionase-like amidohydrolase
VTGAVVCPTAIVLKAQSGDLSSPALPRREYVSPTVQAIWSAFWKPAQRADFEKLWPPAAALVRALHDAGVPLMVGTDLVTPGIIPGFSVHDEMALWQDAGIPAADVLRSATLVPARFLGKDGRLGTIAAGKAASLVLVRGNPLEDIGNAARIESVFLRGRYFRRADLDRMLEEARAAAVPRGAR